LGEPLRSLPRRGFATCGLPRVGLSAPSPSRLRVRTRGAHSPQSLRWFRYYPSRWRTRGAPRGLRPRVSARPLLRSGYRLASRASGIKYASIKYLLPDTRARSAILATSIPDTHLRLILGAQNKALPKIDLAYSLISSQFFGRTFFENTTINHQISAVDNRQRFAYIVVGNQNTDVFGF
jgi:hypothetical protein